MRRSEPVVAALIRLALLGVAAGETGACKFEAGADLRCSRQPAGRCAELAEVPAATQELCCAACSTHATCNAAVLMMEGSAKTCFLKELAPGVTLSDKRPGAVGCLLAHDGPVPPAPPLPHYPFRNHTLSIAERVKDLVSRLTLDEKILQMTRGGAAANTPSPAVARLGLLPHIWGTECATGLGSDDAGFAGDPRPFPPFPVYLHSKNQEILKVPRVRSCFRH